MTAYSDAKSFVNNYPLYSLIFLEKVIFETENDKKDNEILSAEYNKARTFTKNFTKPSYMNKIDRDLVRDFSRFLNDPKKLKL